MLPNFRKTDTDIAKSQPTIMPADSSTDTSAMRATFAARPGTDNRNISVIGADLTIKGSLVSKGQVHVDGIVDGDIHGANVVIGQTATVTGEVVADEVVIKGHVIGAIRSKRVVLQQTSQVEGDIYHQSLSIEQGAMFEGKSRRTKDDPRTIVAQKAAPLEISVPTPPRLPETAH